MKPCSAGFGAPVECDVWRSISAQVGRSVPLRCRDEFTTRNSDFELVVYGQLRQS